MAWRTIAVAFVLAAPAFASGPTPPEKGLAAEHAQVRAAATQARNAGEPGRHADRFADLYRRRLTAMLGQLPAQPDSDLHELFALLEEASFYAAFSDYEHRQEYLAGLRRVVGELRSRDALRDGELNAFYGRLVARREFGEAAALVRDSGGTLRPEYAAFDLQAPRGNSGPFGYVLDDDGRLRLKRVTFPDDGNYLVVVVGCHFAEDAARALSHEPRLAELLSGKRVVWLFDDSVLEVEALAAWKREFPRFKASIAYDNAAWAGVVFGSTPSFHYFRGGTLVHSHEGWDDEKGVTELVEQLESTGLIASDAGTNHAADSANAPR